MTFARPEPPIAIDRVLDDPSEVHTLIARGSPYYSVQRYVENLDQLRALLPIGGAVAYASFQVLTRKLASLESPFTTHFYTGLTGSLIVALPNAQANRSG